MTDEQKTPLKERLWRRPSKWFLFGIPLGGFAMLAIGAIGLGTFNFAVHETSSLEFCISCHEMEANAFAEYQQSVHYQNASGVRAVCADCHLPNSWGPKVLKKMEKGFKEIPAKLLGTISTPEKYEARRLEMAENVWAEMKASDSRECRNCHSLESMDPEAQGRRTAKKHSMERHAEKGETCIDCHKGIAHKLPEGFTG
ncbi:LOW QUALITY PROTEIN: trimethylamine-N-oxide reductase cytochrome c-type subunit TorC [Alteromonadaceae bacterium 2753L.S.0a.02]|nr:trimethylamine-N-oxide reductase cytochrome c-type subunit TorC [Alteromonadaceae bacterium 2753L.S.0a.02]TVZ40678.1 LOW QUALITY PROTEIN: trimethylamine-N-oxide reductase cytochrome c-type subunit TorC [Alteromonadaceae bacterium 2753L.S.0a.02]